MKNIVIVLTFFTFFSGHTFAQSTSAEPYIPLPQKQKTMTDEQKVEMKVMWVFEMLRGKQWETLAKEVPELFHTGYACSGVFAIISKEWVFSPKGKLPELEQFGREMAFKTISYSIEYAPSFGNHAYLAYSPNCAWSMLFLVEANQPVRLMGIFLPRKEEVIKQGAPAIDPKSAPQKTKPITAPPKNKARKKTPPLLPSPSEEEDIPQELT